MSELYHSDVYLGADFSDGIKHWKYIKKYKGSNGKWRYVYADKNTHKNISKDLSIADNYRYDEEENQRKSDYYFSVYEQSKKDDPAFARKMLTNSVEYQSQAYRDSGEADIRELSAYAAIYKNSISSLSRERIEAGKRAVSKLLEKLKKK